MANKKITGTGIIRTSDYKTVKWIGKLKDGTACKITVKNALNKENINWGLQDKGEVVQLATFEGGYTDEDLENGNVSEPWEVEYADGTRAGRNPGKILLGMGKFYVDDNPVGLTRGGGTFNVERTYREIPADGDRGLVVDRVEIDEGRPKLAFNALEIIGNMSDIFPAVAVSEASEQ